MGRDLKFFVMAAALSVICNAACTAKTQAPLIEGDSFSKAEAALVHSPSFENHINMGLQHAKKGQREQALAMYIKAREMSPTSPLAWNNVCAELNTQRRFLEAMGQCEKAVELDPNFALARGNLEFTRSKVKENQTEILAAKRALLAKPDATGAELVAAGFNFYAIKDYPSATELWTKVTDGDPEYAKAQNNLATVFILNNQLDAAEKHLQKALKLEPQNELFKNNKAWLEQRRAAN